MRYVRMSALGLGLAMLLSGCAGGGTAGAGCAGYADNPHISEPSHMIVAKSRTYCQGVSTVTITMNLQKRQGQAWLNVRSQTETIRSPLDNVKNVRQVVGPCLSGTYRHEVVPSRIIGIDGAPIPIQSPVDYSQEVSIRC